MFIKKKFVTVYSKDGSDIVTLVADSCQLSYDPNVYLHLEHDEENEGLKILQKDVKFSWVELQDKPSQESKQRRPKNGRSSRLSK